MESGLVLLLGPVEAHGVLDALDPGAQINKPLFEFEVVIEEPVGLVPHLTEPVGLVLHGLVDGLLEGPDPAAQVGVLALQFVIELVGEHLGGFDRRLG